MMFLAVAAGVALALAFGVGVGSVPGLNENLHINLWFVVPISGLIAGMLLGLLQFGAMRALGRPVRGVAVALLALGCAAGYAATEYGVYRSMEIEVADEEGASASVRLSELMGFGH